MNRLISLCLVVTFVTTMVITPRVSYAQGVPGLPEPGTMVHLSLSYVPLMLTGLTVHPENPLLMDFIVSTGNSGMTADQVKKESGRLIKYFLACLTIPEHDQWVNLSPYEKDRIVPEDLGQTVLGRDMLAQDYLLKQLTASLIYPEKDLGKDFWDKVYAKASQMYGTTQIPVNTFNKVWILPDTAKVYGHKDTVFVVKSHLKVMLDEDYLALSHHVIPAKTGIHNKNNINTLGSNIVRQIILPAIEQEVNTGKNFAQLRQIYNSMILAVWFKKNLKQALLNQVYTDKAKVNGVNVDDLSIKEKIYQQYLQAYKKGVFNYIKEEVDQSSHEVIPRKYFSGGITPVTGYTLATEDQAMAAFRDEQGVNYDLKGVGVGITGLTQGASANAAMMVNVSEAPIRDIVEKKGAKVVADMDDVNRLNVAQAEALISNRFAAYGFDGMANRMGWTLPNLIEILKNPKMLAQTLQDVQMMRGRPVIISGMGGSGLSTETVNKTFANLNTEEYQPREFQPISLRSTDPTVIKEILEGLVRQYRKSLNNEDFSLKDLLKILIIPVISKSGTTAETESHLRYFAKLYAAEGVDPTGHFILYTDPGSPMDWILHVRDTNLQGKDLERQKFLEKLKPDIRYIQLNMKTDIGGRYTAPTTNVFLLPLALQFASTDIAKERILKVLELAKEMNSKPVDQDQFVLLAAFLFYLASVKNQDKVTFFVPEEFKGLPMWSEQLFEESLGKDGKGVTIIFGEDLDMTKLKSVEENDRVFLRINLNGQETSKAFFDQLKDKGYPIFNINVDSIDQIGGLMLGLERTVAFMGYLWKINFTNQLGVEGYKNRTRDVMAQIQPGQKVQIPANWETGKATYGNILDFYYEPIYEAGRQRQKLVNDLRLWESSSVGQSLPLPADLQVRVQQMAVISKREASALKSGNLDGIISKIEKGIITEKDIDQELQRLKASKNYAPALYAAFLNVAYAKGLLEIVETSSYGRMSPQFAEVLQSSRSKYTEAFKVATKLGEGPDINHSYVQNNINGNRGIFNTFVMPNEAAQPDPTVLKTSLSAEALNYDENLLRAPTIGTVQSLIDVGRFAVLIKLHKGIKDLSGANLQQIGWFFSEASGYLHGANPAMTVETKPIDANARLAKFGTSGDRGIIDWPEEGRVGDFNIGLVRRDTQGIAEFGLQTTPEKQRTVLIGYDTRYRNPEFSKEEAQIMAANGFKVLYVKNKAIPTPVLASYIARRKSTMFGVINNTASHSPYTDGGLKFSPNHGGAADTETTDTIQKLANEAKEYKTMDYDEAVKGGLIIELDADDLVKEYVDDYLIPTMKATKALDGKSMWKDIVDYMANNPAFNLIVDPLQGTGVDTDILLHKRFTEAVGRQVAEIIHTNNKDPKFSNIKKNAPQPMGDPVKDLIERVKSNPTRFGLAQDGDVDRFGVIDFGGNEVPANDMVALLVWFLKKDVGLDGAVVKTVATSNFANAVAKYLGLKLIETPVGFKYTVEQVMNGEDVLVGGEESAHVGTKPFMQSWDDGFATGLMALWIVAKTGKSLMGYKKEIEAEIGQSYQMKAVTVRDERSIAKNNVIALITAAREEMKSVPALEISLTKKAEELTGQKVESINTMDGLKLVFESGDWILMRPSGTEPAAKLYVEVSDPERLDAMFKAAKELMGADKAQISDGVTEDDDYVVHRPAIADKAAAVEPGGIDLNSRNLKMQSSGEKVNVAFDPAMIAQFKCGDFSGVRIQILDVVPINLMTLLGLKEDEETGRLAKV